MFIELKLDCFLNNKNQRNPNVKQIIPRRCDIHKAVHSFSIIDKYSKSYDQLIKKYLYFKRQLFLIFTLCHL